MSTSTMSTSTMSSTSTSATSTATTTTLRLASADGPVFRTVLDTPLRDATRAEIPVIDVAGLGSPHLADRQRVAAAIRAAATGPGFFYIQGHGIPDAVLAAAHAAVLAFFRQPPAAKLRAAATASRFGNGYYPPKTQRLNPAESVDVRESFSWAYDPHLDPAVADPAAIPPAIAAQLRAEPFPWDATAHLAPFRPAVVLYWQHCLALARRLVRAIALSLDLPETAFDAKFSHPDASLALNYYPSLTGPSIPDASSTPSTDVSIGSHTDFQLFTILWQDDAGGLQVLTRDGQWLRAPPLPGTFVVNIADFLQRITNDRYVSTVHRVRNTSGRERLSMPFFVGFNRNESCGVLDTCVGPGETKKYPEISCFDWVDRRARAMNSQSGLGEVA